MTSDDSILGNCHLSLRHCKNFEIHCNKLVFFFFFVGPQRQMTISIVVMARIKFFKFSGLLVYIYFFSDGIFKIFGLSCPHL